MTAPSIASGTNTRIPGSALGNQGIAPRSDPIITADKPFDSPKAAAEARDAAIARETIAPASPQPAPTRVRTIQRVSIPGSQSETTWPTTTATGPQMPAIL